MRPFPPSQAVYYHLSHIDSLTLELIIEVFSLMPLVCATLHEVSISTSEPNIPVFNRPYKLRLINPGSLTPVHQKTPVDSFAILLSTQG